MLTSGEILERNACYHPEREAYICADRRVTHSQWFDRTKRLADGLHKLGLRRQDRVAVLSMNCLEFYEMYAAAEVASYICAPVNYRLAPPEVLFMLRDSQAKILVFESQYAGLVDGLRAELADVKHYVCIGETPSWAIDFETVVAAGSAAGPPIVPRPEDYIYLWYTSGTTGRPKGVPWRQDKVCETATRRRQN